MDFNSWWRRVVILRRGHHILPVMYANFVTIFGFIFISLSILCTRSVARRMQSWASLTVLYDCTLQLAFDLVLTSSLFIALYSLITSGEGGHFL